MMDKMLTVCVLLVSYTLQAQNDSVGKQFVQVDSTGFGVATGAVVGKEIGMAGGTITSADGRVELTFPEGALRDVTLISIQPVTNMLDRTDVAYRLEPSGLEFVKPVQIKFHYSNEEAEECPPDLKSFVLQNEKGRWSYFEYDELDTVSRILTGSIHHFSALVTNWNDVLLQPDTDQLMVGQIASVWIMNRNVKVDTGFLKGEYELAEFKSRERLGIFVNGKPGGDDEVGRARMITGSTLIDYVAPSQLLRKNPVEIKLAFKYFSKKKKRYVWGSSKCHIKIYDAYSVSVIQEFPSRGGTGGKLIDSARFNVFLYPNPDPDVRVNIKLNDIKNFEPLVLKQGVRKPFRERIYTKDAQGTIHITESFETDLSHSDPPRRICVEFPGHRVGEVLLYKVQTRARGISGPISPVTENPSDIEIEFAANGKKQSKVNAEKGGEITTIVVRPFGRKTVTK